MILVLVPFWTSILVRVAAWIVLLQSAGLVNRGAARHGAGRAPLALLFNRTGVVIAMVHILLPFMILPLYSVMKSVPPTYLRAAISLGSSPLAAFLRVYVPQTYPASAPARCWCSSWRSATTSRRRCWAGPTTRCSPTTWRSTPT